MRVCVCFAEREREIEEEKEAKERGERDSVHEHGGHYLTLIRAQTAT